MSDNRCSICLKGGLKEDAPVLTISGYGVPRCLCDECAEKINIITYGREPGEISDTIKDIAAEVADKSAEDRFVYDTVVGMLEYASDRLDKIEKDSWDFALDGAESEEELEDIPEALKESEEDRLLDEVEAEKMKKMDKILNLVYPIAFVVLLGLLLYFYFSST